MELAELFKAYIDRLNQADWAGLELYFTDDVLLNKNQLSRDEYLSHLQKQENSDREGKWELDVLLCDVNAGSIAARIVRKSGGSQSPVYAKHVFCWVTNSRIKEITEIYDVDAMSKQETDILKAPTWTGKQPPQPTDLTEFYREYINCINSRTMATQLSRFCHPVVTHNGVRMTTGQYRELIDSSQEAISGLKFNIHTIITDSTRQQLAAKLDFTGTPVQEWAGAKPNGKAVEFSEHVFYWLDQGKISEVVSLVDLKTYREQLGSTQ